MELLTVLLGTAFLLCLLFVWHLTKYRGHLETLGIPMVKPVGLLGSGPFDLHKQKMHDVHLERFQRFGAKTYGRYDGIIPVISTIDPDIIKTVLVKKFENFVDTFDESDDKNLTLDISGGDRWRNLRKGLSPTFTSGKLKGMLEPMTDVADKTIDFVQYQLRQDKTKEIDLKKIFQEFALNTICRCAFGIDANAHKDPEQDIVKYGSTILQELRLTNWFMTIFFQLFNYFPILFKFIPFWPPTSDKIFDMTKVLMKQRSSNGIVINDFVNHLLELQKAKAESPDADNVKHLTNDMITAQGIIFFLAGYETTANTMSTLCYNLAKNPQEQEALYAEIQEILENHDGKLDHTTIADMPYMDAAINEDLRLNGPVTFHQRLCTKDTEVSPGFVIKEGMRVEMPIHASHLHEDFFPGPTTFKPERFLKENSGKIIPYTFRAFGGGPRVCIGQRFAMTEMKLMMSKLLSKYRLVATENTRLDVYTGDFFLFTYPDMKLRLEER